MSGETSLSPPPAPHVPGDSLSFLLVCDEWFPTLGGISRFNRCLACALAAAGHRTTCLVKSCTSQEQQDADAHGVRLVTAEHPPAGPNLFVYSRSVADEAPDVVVGHDIVSGSAAWTWARRYLPDAHLVHIVHTPPHIEPYKRHDSASMRTELREQEMRRIAADADVLAAVGPSLARGASAMLGGMPVLQLDPGMDVPPRFADGPREAPGHPTVLIFSRGAHVQPKGLDIAAHAVAALTVPHGRPQPDLLIRGAPAHRCDGLRRQLVSESRLSRGRIDVRPYTDDPDQLEGDLARATLCVMPSRAEGFGLAALEAIAAATPVLVSDKSGLAETLRDHLGRLAEPMIVPVVDDLERDVAQWKAAMQEVLDNPQGAFQYAWDIRARLQTVLRWEAVAAQLTASLRIPAQRHAS